MPVSLTLQAAFRYWEQLDCSTSLRLTLLGRAGMWAEVLSVTVEPEHFADPAEYAKASYAVAFLKKNPDVPGFSSEVRRQTALATWYAGEASCYHANERLSPSLISPFSDDMLTQFLRKVRRRLIEWLGPAPGDDELKTRARHGPGTTFSSTVANPTAADKYEDKMSLTPGASIHLLNLAGTKWMSLTETKYLASGSPFDFVGGNRHAIVPKDAKTDRNIGIEPTVNLYFQLAVGSALRSRLRRKAGWDLDNASAIHRHVAREASIHGHFATIDLRNASDTLCKNLVRILFRDTSWLPLLEDLRSPKTRVAGRWHVLEKFSSMGNGYTFELESCIFAALASVTLELKGHVGVLGHDLFVFGDDIIVPTDTYELVTAVLREVGFEINTSKSFHKTAFRESCGGDFFDGEPVRGFYLKQPLVKQNNQPWVALHNGVYSLQFVTFKSFLEWVRDRLPVHIRGIGGSARLGDQVLRGVEPVYKWRNGIRWVRAIRWGNPILVRWSYFSEEARLACRLTGYGDTFGINTRGIRRNLETVWVSDS